MKWVAVALGIVLVCCAVAYRGASNEVYVRQVYLDSLAERVATAHGIVEYAIIGEGPPLVVLHGAGGGFDQGLLLASAMAPAGRRLIVLSRFGYLGSTLPEDASTTAQARAIAELLDGLEVGSVDFLAMSGGVPPALRFAQIFPARTGKLVLLSSAPVTPFSPDVEGRPVPTWVYTALLGNNTVYWLLSRYGRDQLRTGFDARPELMAGLSNDESRFVEELIDGFLPASARLAGLRNEGAAVDPSTHYALDTITAPTLIVHAGDDRMNPFEVAEFLKVSLANPTYLPLETGGHLLLGHHSELQEVITGFLAR